MRRSVALITGAGGEIGHGLIERLVVTGRSSVVTLDLNPLDPALAGMVTREFTGSITDVALLERILAEFEVDTVYHLAALLSTRSEFTPLTAHHVNVEGTLNLLEFAQREAESHGRPVLFLYPSSIAAYGLPDLETKRRAGRVREDEYNAPSTMYGCNKLYCEQLGRYYARFYKQLAAESHSGRVDFRCVRFPGLISGVTVPSGGTSDYAPEMIHAAARGEPYACFVRPDTRIPFMGMPDGVEALLTLAAPPRAPHAHRLQPVGVQPVGRRDSRRGAPRVSRRADQLAAGRQTPGDRRLLAGGRGRSGGAHRLGVRTQVQFRSGVSRVPHSDDSRALQDMTHETANGSSRRGARGSRHG